MDMQQCGMYWFYQTLNTAGRISQDLKWCNFSNIWIMQTVSEEQRSWILLTIVCVPDYDLLSPHPLPLFLRVRKSKNFPDSKIFVGNTFWIKCVNRVYFQGIRCACKILSKRMIHTPFMLHGVNLKGKRCALKGEVNPIFFIPPLGQNWAN